MVIKIKKIIGILLAISFVLTMFTGCVEENKNPNENTKNYVEIATDFINALKQQQYANAYSYFSAEMKNSLPQEQLKTIWENFIATYGSFEEIQQTRQTMANNYTIVYVNCTFSNNYLLVLRIVFDEQKNINGFWLDNAILMTTYTAPDYVNKQNFTEINITIGTSPWQLPATLSIPNGTGPFSCAILVHGSGPNDRDETIGPNKPFKDIAWGLASKGIAVLRYDKRTKVYPDRLAKDKNLTVKEEVVDDVLSAINYLQIQSYIPINKIIIIGHSLGAMMVPDIALLSDNINGCVLMAAPARPLEDLFLSQTIYLANLDGSINQTEQETIDYVESQVEKIKTLNITNDEKIFGAYKAYWQYLATYNQTKVAQNLSVPLLFLQGMRDYQVTYEDDFLVWEKDLSGKKNVTFKTFATLNHLFMSGEGPPNSEEYMIENHVAKDVINTIIDWIQQL